MNNLNPSTLTPAEQIIQRIRNTYLIADRWHFPQQLVGNCGTAAFGAQIANECPELKDFYFSCRQMEHALVGGLATA